MRLVLGGVLVNGFNLIHKMIVFGIDKGHNSGVAV